MFSRPSAFLNRSRFYWLGLVCVLALAAAMRFLMLDSLPPGLYRDEAANGFDAWAILHTACDRWGNFFPLHFRAFDDWREGLFNYSLVPVLWVMGLSAGAVRAGAALWGLLTVAGAMFFSLRIHSRSASLASGLVLALMPWHIYLSRFGVRAITAPALALGAAGCFLVWLGRDGARARTRWLFAAAVFCGLGFYCYTPMKLFIPLLAAALLCANARRLKKTDIGPLLRAFGLLCVIVSPVAWQILTGGTQERFNRISVFSVSSAWSDTFLLFARNYAAHFNAGFLFRGIGLLCWMPKSSGLLFWSCLPLLAAFVCRLAMRRKAGDLSLALWILLSPVPAGLTVESIPHPIRTLCAVPAVALACGAGFAFAAEGLMLLRPRLRAFVRALFAVWALAFCAEGARFADYYFGRYRTEAIEHFQYGYGEAVRFVLDYGWKYNQVVFHAPYNSDYYRRPFIFYMFYSHTPPAVLQADIGGLAFRKGMVTGFFDRFRVSVSLLGDRELANGTMLVGMGTRDYTRTIPNLSLIGAVKRPDGRDAFRIYAAESGEDPVPAGGGD